MAKAHEGKGTSFTPKTMLPVDGDTVALWHYDINKLDTIEGLSPIGSSHVIDFRNNGQMGVKLASGQQYLSHSHTVSGWVYIRSVPRWGRWFDFNADNIRDREGQGALFAFKGNFDGIAYVQRGTNNALVHVHEMQTPFPTNQWIYLTLTYDNPTYTSKIYYNGIFQSTNRGIGPYNAPVTNDNWIGRSHWDRDAGNIDGKFDGFTIWNHVRTPTQIREDMWITKFSGGYETDPGIALSMPMTTSSPILGITNNPISSYNRDTHLSMFGNPNRIYSTSGTAWSQGTFHRGVTELTYGTYVESNTSFPRPAEGTIEFWMRPAAIVDYWNVFSSGLNNVGFRVELSGNFAPLVVLSGDDSGNYTACQVIAKGGFLASNDWTHVAFSWDSNNQLHAYVNGEFRGTFVIPYKSSNFNLIRIGTGFDYTESRSMTGYMADVRIWNTVRTKEQIQDCMSRQLSGYEEGLLRNWRLDEISGTTCYDASPNKVNATVVGPYAYVRRVDKAPYVPVSRGLLDAQIRREPATNRFIVGVSDDVEEYRTRNKFGSAIAVGAQTTNLVSGGECDYDLPRLAGMNTIQCQSATLQTAVTYSGRKALRIRGGVDIWGGSYRLGTWASMNGLTVGTTYTFSAMIMVPRTESNQNFTPADFGLTFYSTYSTGVYGPTKFDEWQRVSLTWKVPPGTTFVMPSLNISGNVNSGTEMYVDEVQLEALPYPTTFDPSPAGRTKGQLIYQNPLRGCNKGTISMWAKLEARPSISNAYQSMPLVSYYRLDDTTPEYGIQPLFFGPTPDSSYFLWTQAIGEGAPSAKYTAALPNIYDWHHYALTYNGPTLKVYLDGQLVYTQTNFDHAEVRRAPTVFIGSERPGSSTRQFIGLIDEVRFDKVDRTAEEIATFYNASAPFYPR